MKNFENSSELAENGQLDSLEDFSMEKNPKNDNIPDPAQIPLLPPADSPVPEIQESTMQIPSCHRRFQQWSLMVLMKECKQ